MNNLLSSFDSITNYCFALFKLKNDDYGPAWLIYRDSSLVDEIWRKAKRIRTIEERGGVTEIPEDRDSEYIGIINYSIMFLIKDRVPNYDSTASDLDFDALNAIEPETLYGLYKSEIAALRELLIKKNTDYGDAWRGMSLCSMTDQILMRVLRIKRILDKNGKLNVSEGIQAQLEDIINYCVFALIKLNFKTPSL